jgi:hypothetical protein
MTTLKLILAMVCRLSLAAAICGETGGEEELSVNPSALTPIGTISDRYQSYNVEMLEVTGGKFWKPYGPELDSLLRQKPQRNEASRGDTPSGMNPALYQYRPPLDLTDVRLRRLAAALGPAYVRVSGTWANTTYFPDSDEAPTKQPKGFMGVLTRPQWKRVLDFSKAVDAGIVTSFAISVGTRDAAGVWTTEQAKRILDCTKAAGGRIDAAEFMNEPTLASMGGAPVGYDPSMYGRDFKIFQAFAKEAAPGMLVLGPGSVGETTGDWGLLYGLGAVLATRELLAASGPEVDAFSYHHYGASSQRCTRSGVPGGTSAADRSAIWISWDDSPNKACK